MSASFTLFLFLADTQGRFVGLFLSFLVFGRHAGSICRPLSLFFLFSADTQERFVGLFLSFSCSRPTLRKDLSASFSLFLVFGRHPGKICRPYFLFFLFLADSQERFVGLFLSFPCFRPTPRKYLSASFSFFLFLADIRNIAVLPRTIGDWERLYKNNNTGL